MSQHNLKDHQKELMKLTKAASESVKRSAEMNNKLMSNLPEDQRSKLTFMQNKVMDAIKSGDVSAITQVMEEAKSIIYASSN